MHYNICEMIVNTNTVPHFRQYRRIYSYFNQTINYSDIDEIVGGVTTLNYHFCEGGLIVHPLLNFSPLPHFRQYRRIY